jgi:ParB-like chromosome segregation protein Spo0J
MIPELKSIPISEIAIGDRFRQDLGDIPALAKSISDVGLLNPPMVGTDGVLIHGRRRLAAAKSLGWKEVLCVVFDPEDALKAEHDENEIRKSFTQSERVAIAQAIKEKLGNRQGQRTDKEELRQNFGEVQKGHRTDDIAAKAAGFGNAETLRQAEKVVDKGIEPLVHAMDAGTVSINAAAELAKEQPEVQEEVLKQGPKAVKQHAKQKREERKAEKPKPTEKPQPIQKPTPQPEPQPEEDDEEYPVDNDPEAIAEREYDQATKIMREAFEQAMALCKSRYYRMGLKAQLQSLSGLINLNEDAK